MKAFFHIIDLVTEKIGNAICYMIILIMLAIGTATISRYFFNEPMSIVWPIIKQLFGIIVLLGAAYALLYDRHIRVEILYDQFPPWMKLVTRVVTLLCFISFLGALTWQGVSMARIAIMLKETSTHLSRLPVYPFKVFMPIATGLFLIQGIAFYIHTKKPSEETQTAEKHVPDILEQSENQS